MPKYCYSLIIFTFYYVTVINKLFFNINNNVLSAENVPDYNTIWLSGNPVYFLNRYLINFVVHIHAR